MHEASSSVDAAFFTNSVFTKLPSPMQNQCISLSTHDTNAHLYIALEIHHLAAFASSIQQGDL